MQQSPYLGAKVEFHALAPKPGGQCLAENVAVARCIGRQMKAARHLGGGLPQGRLDRQRIAPVQHIVRNAEFLQRAGSDVAVLAFRFGLE
ncbi:hypothetical protein D9M69_626870 [compost metagenome]